MNLTATIRDGNGATVPGAAVILQRSKNGKTKWRNTYPLTTDASGVAWKVLELKKRSTYYYRWYVVATSAYPSNKSGAQRVKVK